MGSIIKENTEGEPSTVLTETGKGGLFSQGYLRDAPALEYLGVGETAVFVLADDDTGVERVRDDDRTTISPGKGYRAITVVTDRRVIVLVGNAAEDGDKRVTLPLVEVERAGAEGDALVIEMSSGVTWHCHAEDDGISDVATYVGDASRTWQDVESILDTVKRSIVEATSHRDGGAYAAALDAIGDARDGIQDAQHAVARFGADWPSEALVERVEHVRDRCLTTAADVRIGDARATVDEGEKYWREGEYERARDAFDEGREAYEAVAALDPRHRREIEDIDVAMDRLDHSIERLDGAPLRNAIEADRRAEETEPSHEALDALAEARERYEAVLELDTDADRRRFAGDRDRIREQHEDVTDRFVETARELGTDALEAGVWYCETGKPDLAEPELEAAIEAFDRGLTVAETERPGSAEEMRTKRTRASERLAELRETSERADDDSVSTAGSDRDDAPDESAADPTADEPSDGEQTDIDQSHEKPHTNSADDPTDGSSEVEPSSASDGTSDDGETGEGTTAGGPAEPTTATTDDGRAQLEASLRNLSPDQFDRVVTTVVEAMGWHPSETASAACDYLASPEGDGDGTLGIRALPNEDGTSLEEAHLREAASLARSVPTVDEVMIVTTRPITDAAMAAARAEKIRLLGVEYLADALYGPESTTAETAVPTPGE